LLRFNATRKAVDELERNLKLTDGIRYLTVRAGRPPTISPSAPGPVMNRGVAAVSQGAALMKAPSEPSAW
jgi:hypothetical protein